MVAVLMMQAALDEIVGVVAVRHRLMPAAGPMDMAGFVHFMPLMGNAAGRIALGHFNHMLLDAVSIWMMQMAVVQIVDVVAVLHGDVTAPRAVMMRMFGMGEMAMIRHERFPSVH